MRAVISPFKCTKLTGNKRQGYWKVTLVTIWRNKEVLTSLGSFCNLNNAQAYCLNNGLTFTVDVLQGNKP